jgi:hypothetical protein
MRFVRAAESFKDQNLILSQQGHSLYFTTTRVIHPRQELQVWYSLPYANKRGLPLLHPDTEKRGNAVHSTWSTIFTTIIFLLFHQFSLQERGCKNCTRNFWKALFQR